MSIRRFYLRGHFPPQKLKYLNTVSELNLSWENLTWSKNTKLFCLNDEELSFLYTDLLGVSSLFSLL